MSARVVSLEAMEPRSPSGQTTTPISELTPDEQAALTSAASWYANYHAGIIAQSADDGSAYSVVKRERFADLVRGLRKLGVRLPPPEAMLEQNDPADRAA